MLLMSLALGAAVAAPPVPAPPPPPIRFYAPPAPPSPPRQPPPSPRRRGEPRPPVQRSGTIVSDDYPIAAIRAEEEGSVTIRMNVDAIGRVAGCAIASSSGSATLDAAACSLATRRFRFSPALDSRGRAVPGVATRSIRWELPDALPPPPLVNGWVAVTLPPARAGVAPAECLRSVSTPLLNALASDFCAELAAPDAPPPAARPMRRILLTFGGGLGVAGPAPPAPGRLVYREEAQFAVAADGSVTGCRMSIAVSRWREVPFDLCRYLETTDGPYFAEGFPATDGRASFEVYE